MSGNTEYVFVKESGWLTHADGRVHVRKGEAWTADDPLVKAHRDAFDPDPPRVRSTEAPVERATRAPGEQRTAVKRTGKAAK